MTLSQHAPYALGDTQWRHYVVTGEGYSPPLQIINFFELPMWDLRVMVIGRGEEERKENQRKGIIRRRWTAAEEIYNATNKGNRGSYSLFS